MWDLLPSFQEFIEIIKNNQFAQGGIIVSFLLAIPNYILPYLKKIWLRIERLIIYRVNIEETDDLFVYLEMWLSDNYKAKYRNVEAVLKLNTKYDHKNHDLITGKDLTSLEEEVLYKQFNDTFYLRRGLNYLRVYKGREKLENASSFRRAFYNKFQISGIFSKRTINNLIKEIHEEAKYKMKEAKKKTVKVKVSTDYGEWVNSSTIEPKQIKNVIFKGKEDLISDINNFISSKMWYKKREISYKRGYMFTGKAGTGKTSFVLSLAKYLNRTIYFLQLNGINDSGIRNSFNNLPSNSILVIEDIDAAFEKRDGKKETKFTFSTLLNCLDGVFSTEDVITIFTTNHIEKLDPALIRTGRIDYIAKFERPSREYVGLFLSNFYEKEIEVKGDYRNNLPMSDIQDACLRHPKDYNLAISLIKSKSSKQE